MIQRDIEYSGQFSKDVKLAQKRHKDMNKLKYLMTLLILSLIHISEPTRRTERSRMPSSA